jgi:hypothetical protein
MRCPICGAKLVDNKLCKYCKVTNTQIENASNKKVKQYRKEGNGDLIYFSSVVPKDVNKIKLLLYTILFGLLGINHYYVNRKIRWIFSMVSYIGSFLILVIMLAGISSIIFTILYYVLFTMMAINVVMWIFDIFNVLFGTFKIPVVLASKEEK